MQQDSNGDGVVNPGEQVQIAVTVQNSGTGYIEGLQGTVSVQGDYATIDCGRVVRLSYKDGLEAGQGDSLGEYEEDCYSSGTLTFSVESATRGARC